jgi:hypothetical protein
MPILWGGGARPQPSRSPSLLRNHGMKVAVLPLLCSDWIVDGECPAICSNRHPAFCI